MNETIYAGYEDTEGKVHFIQLPKFRRFYNIYSESHLKLSYDTLKETGLLNKKKNDTRK